MPTSKLENSTNSLSGWLSIASLKGSVDADTAPGARNVSNSASDTGATENRCGISSSASLCSFGHDGLATITGAPRWNNSELAREASLHGDASALIKAYDRHGKKLLDHLGGSFSFVIVDGEKQSLFAAIDRIGQETLYHTSENGRLLFGSTAESVLAQLPSPASLDPQSIYSYFYFHMVPSPESVYSGISKLTCAHYLAASPEGIETTRYWSPKFAKTTSRSFPDMGSELKQQLRSAVERSLGNAASVGTFLSGGLDSSTVSGMLAELTGGTCKAYAIGFDEEGYDEMAFARNSARHFGIDLKEYYVTPQDVLDELPTIATSYDEPFGNSSALPAYFCARRAREDGIDCLLAGDGGDELFAGNGRYAKQQLFNLYSRIPRALSKTILEPVVGMLPEGFSPASKIKNYISQANIALPDRLQSYNYLNRIPPEQMFSKKFLEAVDTERPLQLQRDTYNSLDDASDLCRMLYLDWQYTLADNDLRKVSEMCSIAGISVHYPLLDDELIAFSCQIPDSWKLKRGNLRHFFKESLSDWLPEATINKSKQGFGLPFGLWMQSYRPLNEMANDSIQRLKDREFFRVEFLDDILRLHKEEHASYYGELIWILMIFDLWLEGRKTSSL